jgi:hypothetical protein
MSCHALAADPLGAISLQFTSAISDAVKQWSKQTEQTV